MMPLTPAPPKPTSPMLMPRLPRGKGERADAGTGFTRAVAEVPGTGGGRLEGFLSLPDGHGEALQTATQKRGKVRD